MQQKACSRLLFRRQYVISLGQTECPLQHNTYKLNNDYYLYAHLDLKVTEKNKGAIKIVLLGDIFDFSPFNKSNIDILNELAELSFPEIIRISAKYSGRYVLVYQNEFEFNLLHDSFASRKIFFASVGTSFWFGSQPHLLAKVLNLKETQCQSKLDYYHSPEFEKHDGAGIGDTTIYDEIHQVLPNHYFDATLGRSVRLFPSEPLEKFSVEEVERKCAEIIKGNVENIVARYNVMLPVTAGKDSRMLLAATKKVKDKVFYYINKRKDLDERSKDISVPKSLLRKLGLNFHIIDPYIDIDEDFKNTYFINNPRATNKYLPLIYNYYVGYEDKVNLPGNIAFGPLFQRIYGDRKVTAEVLAEVNRVDKYAFAREYYASWLDGIQELCNRIDINILSLFYWEERIGNWGTQIQLDKDIAQEEFNPYNSRLLTSMLLTIDYKLLLPTKYTFHKETIKYLWPDVLQEPINPGTKNQLKSILEFFGIFKFVLKIKRLLKT